MKDLHFTLGNDAGALLMNIAFEHFKYDLSPEKAIETITGSLIGITPEMVRDIFYDKKVLEVSFDGAYINLIDRDEEKHKGFPKMDLANFIVDEGKWIEEKGKEISEMQLSVLRYIKSNNGIYEVNIDVENLISAFFDKNDFDKSEIVYENVNIRSLFSVLKISKEYIDKVQKIYKVFNYIEHHWFKLLKCEDYTEGENTVALVSNNFSIIINHNSAQINDIIDSIDGPLRLAIDAELNIGKQFEKQTYIEPVDIGDGYSAGWLAPDGSFFGLNGEIVNMLHNKLADAIRERIKILDGKDPLTDNDINMDGYLSQNGWVKIHGDNILYDGYEQSRYDLPLIPITDEQIKQIVFYGNKCCQGKLFLSIDRKFCSAAMFGMIEKPMMGKWFDF